MYYKYSTLYHTASVFYCPNGCLHTLTL